MNFRVAKSRRKKASITKDRQGILRLTLLHLDDIRGLWENISHSLYATALPYNEIKEKCREAATANKRVCDNVNDCRKL